MTVSRIMAVRQTMNVSLPPAQERFVRSQVTTGRYRTASEVIRDGLRLLEEAEHRRLVEKWIYEDLSAEEHAALPEEVKARVQAYFQNLVGEAVADVKAGRVVDGPTAIKRLQEELQARREWPATS